MGLPCFSAEVRAKADDLFYYLEEAGPSIGCTSGGRRWSQGNNQARRKSTSAVLSSHTGASPLKAATELRIEAQTSCAVAFVSS